MVDALFLDDGRKQDFGTGSSPVLTTIDNGFPHSTDVDNPEWNRNSSPCAEDLVKLKKHLRLERDGYSIIIKDIIVMQV